MSKHHDDIEKDALESSHTLSEGSVGIVQSKRNIFQRAFDSYKPPIDQDEFSDITPQERAITYLNRSTPKLSRRHLMVISLSSCVGTGLFIGSGSSLKIGGPAALLIGFGVMGIALLCIMATVGEIGVRYPTVSMFYEIPSRFIHPSWGFAVGWIYTFCWMVTVPLELIAGAELTQFWHSDNNPAAKANPVAWVAILYVFDVIINLSGSRVYGELEFIVGIIKMAGVLGFIIFSIIQTCGGPPTNDYLGVSNFYNPKPFMNSFKGVVQVIVSCSFAYGGTEVSGIAAAETANPLKSIPSAVRQAFWRVLVFFMVAILMVCLTVPPITSGIGNSNSGSGSPFVAALKLSGVRALPSIFNVVIICSVVGVSNAAIYASTRTLTSLAIKGANWSAFCYIDRQGRPLVSLAVVLTFSLLCFVAASNKYNEVFDWLYAFAALAFLFAWASICLCHLRIRWALKSQGRTTKDFLYTSPFGIIGSIVGGGISIGVLGLQFWVYLFPINGHPNPKTYFQNDLSIPVFIALLVGHKLWYWKTSKFVSNKELDLDSGVREVDYDNLHRIIEEDKEKEKRNPLLRIARYIC